MTTIVTRASKGSALTWTEGDANITNLNNDKLEAGPAANAAINGFTSTATAGGVTTLTNTSSVYQLFTGGLGQTVVLPSTATLTQGWSFHIVNNSAANLTLNTATSTTLGSILPGTTVMATAISVSSDAASAWEFGYTDFSTVTGGGAVVLSTSPVITGNPSINGGSINATTIGVTTQTSGRFTSLQMLSVLEPAGITSTGAGAYTFTPNAASGTVQNLNMGTATSLTFNGFTTPVAGQSITVIVTNNTVTAITSTMKWAGGVKTLTGTSGAVDIISVYYNGTNYYASIAKGFV